MMEGVGHINGADIINAVTREEHMGGIPSLESVYGAIKTAQVVVNCIDDVRYFGEFNKKQIMKGSNCMGLSGYKVGCDRCGEECPFFLDDIKL